VTDRKRIAPGPAAQWIMRHLRRYRELRGLSHGELSERLAGLGRPIPPQGLRRIERGDRRVDVDDLIALARALGVAPVMLVFPLGQAATVELLPGQEQPTWDAVRWFTGHGSYPEATAGTSRLYTGPYRSPGAVGLFTIHEGLVTDWQLRITKIRLMRRIDDAEAPSTRSQIQTAEVSLRFIEQQVRECREAIRGLGFAPATLPSLPPGLAWLDTLTPDEWAAYLSSNGTTTKEGDPA
jgi:transcriptional regulator with XRE-family HTH domain